VGVAVVVVVPITSIIILLKLGEAARDLRGNLAHDSGAMNGRREGEEVFEYLKQLWLEILLPLAKSRRLYTNLGVEHRAQQNGSHVQLFLHFLRKRKSVLDPKWNELRIGELSTELNTLLNLSILA
jgi:hypothetical protein